MVSTQTLGKEQIATARPTSAQTSGVDVWDAAITKPASARLNGSSDSAQEMDTEKTSIQEQEVQQAPGRSAADWDGPDDAENPHNWSYVKRFSITLVVGLIGFTVTFASSVFTPAVPEIMAHFSISSTVALLGLSLYTVGLGFGPVLAAPISEIAGRGVVYRATLPIFMLFTLGAGFSKTYASFVVCRFFAGVFGAPVLAVGAGTAADLYPQRLLGIASTSFVLWPFAGPSLGPFIGGFVAQHESWRWTQWVVLFLSLSVFILSLPMPETYKKTILARRAKRLNLPPPPKTGPTGPAAIKFLLTVTLVRPLHMLATEPIVAFISLYVSFAFAVLFAFFEAFPIVFGQLYGFTTSQTGLTFLAVGLGVLLAAATAMWCDHHFYQREHRRSIAAGRASTAPEHRLYVAMMGSMGMPIGLFWFAWSARASVHWASCVVAAVPFAWANLSIFIGTSNYLVHTYGSLTGASAMAANGIARYTIAAAFPLFTIQMYTNLGIAWATSLLGFVSVAMLPIPWVLFKWGPRIRAKSQYDTVQA